MILNKITKYYHLYFTQKQSFEGHRHNGFEVNIILNGSLEVTYDDSVFCLSKGSFFIGDANIFHRNRALSAVEFISAHIELSKPCNLPFSCVLSESDFALVKILSEETAEGITKASQCLMQAILFRISDKGNIPPLSENPDSVIYKKAVRYMNENISRSLSVNDISRYCGVCATIFKKSFSACAGKGAMTYFAELKTEYAKQLLRDGFSVKQVSEKLGFSSPSYFSYAFHRNTGVRAVDFKKKVISDKEVLS